MERDGSFSELRGSLSAAGISNLNVYVEGEHGANDRDIGVREVNDDVYETTEGVTMVLQCQLRGHPFEAKLYVPAGFYTDLASVPSPLRLMLLEHHEDRLDLAAVGHDLWYSYGYMFAKVLAYQTSMSLDFISLAERGEGLTDTTAHEVVRLCADAAFGRDVGGRLGEGARDALNTFAKSFYRCTGPVKAESVIDEHNYEFALKHELSAKQELATAA